MIDNYDGDLPAGWTGGEAITKWWRGQHVHLYRLRKPCAQCRAEMVVDVTKEAMQGKARNSGLKLQRCVGCRNASKADAGRSRPHSAAGASVVGAEPALTREEVERITNLETELKEAQDSAAAVATQAAGIRKAVHEELGLSLIGDAINYGTVKAAIQALKGKYELPSAMAEVARFNPHELLKQDIALHGVGVSRTFVDVNGEVETVREKLPWE